MINIERLERCADIIRRKLIRLGHTQWIHPNALEESL